MARAPGIRDRGFTLVETLVMLVIVGMIAIVAIPNLQRVKVKTKTTQALLQISGAYDVARSEAVRRHSPVAIILASDQVMVWEDWDPNNIDTGTNNNQTQDGDEQIILNQVLDSVTILPSVPPAGDASPLPALGTTVYRADGSLQSAGGAAFFRDRNGNEFRVRVNGVTGGSRLEMWLDDSGRWEPHREKWSWKY